jgi:hypothetical protein
MLALEAGLANYAISEKKFWIGINKEVGMT